jgi:oligosaccharide repeat unit polymerase
MMLILVAAVPVAVVLMPNPWPLIQILIGAFLVVLWWGADSDATVIPAILRPAPIVFGSLTIASVSAGALGAGQYEEYFVMWLLQALGMAAGFLLATNLTRSSAGAPRPVLIWRYWLSSRLFFCLFLLAAVTYFVTQGVPALQSDLEQARVDAAEGGSGFIRMFAFLLPTATAAAVGIRGWRKTWLLVAVTLIVMLGYGNRVPFIYFVFPLAVMLAVTTKKLGSGRIIAVAVSLLGLMGALAAWRVYNTEDMASSYQYRDAVATGDSLAIAWSAISHYTQVVPENAMLVKNVIDSGAMPLQFGSTYFTLFASVLPGKQISPDMMLKELNGVQFLGGGIPPTLAGEGYMNFGYFGIFLNALFAMLLLRYWAAVVIKMSKEQGSDQSRVVGLIYGYVLTWVCLAQISGFAGSATVSLAGFLLLLGIRWFNLEGKRLPTRSARPATSSAGDTSSHL